MIRMAIFLVGFLLCTPVWAKNLPCHLLPSFVELSRSMHLKNPKIDASMIAKVGKTYIDRLDPEKIYLTQPEYDSLVKKLNTESASYFLKYEKEKCQVFNDIEKEILSGEMRYFSIIEKSIEMSPKKSIRKEKDDRFKTESELTKSVNESTRNSLFKKEYTKAGLRRLISGKPRLSEGFEKEKTELILKSFLRTFDPHSDYFTESEYQEFDSDVNGSLVGIGVRVVQTPLGVLIKDTIPGGSVAEDGEIKPGDYLISIDGIKIKNLREFLEKIKRPEGSPIKVTVLDQKNKIKTVDLIVKRIELKESKVSSKIIKHNEKNILVVTVPSFYFDEQKGSGSAQDFLAEYNKYKISSPISGKPNPDIQIDLIVMDLRNDPGGLLDEALRMVGLFIEESIVIYSKNANQITAYPSEAAEGQIIIKEPLLILTNRRSASSSEIVTGALKDYNRAIIVGQDHTYGKGTIQSVSTAPKNLNLGAFKVTIAQFYLPKGSSTQLKGVDSDIVIPGQIGEISEKQQPHALIWDEIDTPIKDRKYSDFKKIAELSKKRVDQNPNKFKNLKDIVKPGSVDVVLDEALNIGSDYLQEKETAHD